MSLFRMYWLRMLKSPGLVLLWLALPFVFMGIYILAFGRSGRVSATTLLVIDRDGSFVSNMVKTALGADQLKDILNVIESPDLDDVEKRFEKGSASAALVIPEGFGRSVLDREEVTLTLFTNPRHFFGPKIAEGVLDFMASFGNEGVRLLSRPLELIESLNERDGDFNADDVAEVSRSVFDALEGGSSLGSLRSLDVKVQETGGRETQDFNMGSFFFPGLVLFSLISLSLGLEVRFQLDKVNKLNNRLIASALSPLAIILNQRTYSCLALFVMGAVCGVIGGVAWRIPPQGLLSVGALTLLIILFVVGLNGTIFGVAKTRRAASALSSFILTLLIIVGGGFMPVESFPAALRQFALLTPTGIATSGIVQSLTGRDLPAQVPLLVFYAVGFIVLSVVIGVRKLLIR